VVADGALGGGTTVVLQLVASLFSNGYNVHVITDRGSELHAAAQQHGATAHGLPFFRSKLDFQLPKALRRLLREIEPDVVHVHGARAAHAARRNDAGTPTIYTVHGYHFRYRTRLQQAVSKHAEQNICKRTDIVTFVSKQDRSFYLERQLGPKDRHLAVIPNGVVVSSTTPRNHVGPIQNIAFVGRLVEPKDPLLAIRTFASRTNGAQLHIVGDGPLREQTQKEINRLGVASDVTMHGTLSHKRAQQIIARCDVLLMTSKWEGLPMVALEALAVGTPIVVPALPALREIIDDGITGLLVDGRDPKDFADGLVKLNDPVLRQQFMDAGLLAVTANFSWSSAWEKYRALYDEIATKRDG
jgi:glycosyltransferase involved in cell wall biosynthesis